MTDDVIRDRLLALATARGPAKSICPSEVARDLAADWRPLMPEIRRVAAALQHAGHLRVTRGGLEVDAESGGGPIRITIVQR